MQIQSIIEQLGYPPNQAKVYLAALKMGESTVSEIAERVGLPRTTVEELVLKLHARGWMNYYTKRNRKYWEAEQPDRLLETLKDREASFAAIVPRLRELQRKRGGKPVFRCFVGTEEIKNIFDDIIGAMRHIKAMVSWDDFQEYMGKQFVFDFVERRYKHFLRIQLLTTRTPSAVLMKSQDAEELRLTRFLPCGVQLQRVSNFIYGDKVATVSFNRKEPVGIIIQDPDVAHAQDVYFDNLWEHSMS